MRRIVVFDRVTADGYFAGLDGNLNWVVPDEEIDKAGAAGIPATDTVLFGRRTYEMFASFWPHALDESSTAPDPHRPGGRSPAMRAMAVFLNEANKFVFSRSLKNASWRNSQIVHELDPLEIEAMKRMPGKDMIIFGSGSIVSKLAEHGLVDEYRFVVCPVLLGSGRSLISGVSKTARLSLLDATTYPSGNIALRYVPDDRKP
ncbi:MAG: dihydrofolate reductase family protein [Thermoanaerobaculia bacterium]